MTTKTPDNTPMTPWATPVIAVRILLIFISNHLRQSIIPATKSSRPIASNSNKGMLWKFWRLSLSRILGSRIPMRKTPITMIPTNMRKPPKATANLLNRFVTRNIVSSTFMFLPSERLIIDNFINGPFWWSQWSFSWMSHRNNSYWSQVPWRLHRLRDFIIPKRSHPTGCES